MSVNFFFHEEMSRRRVYTEIVSQGYPTWYAYGVSRGVFDYQDTVSGTDDDDDGLGYGGVDSIQKQMKESQQGSIKKRARIGKKKKVKVIKLKPYYTNENDDYQLTDEFKKDFEKLNPRDPKALKKIENKYVDYDHENYEDSKQTRSEMFNCFLKSVRSMVPDKKTKNKIDLIIVQSQSKHVNGNNDFDDDICNLFPIKPTKTKKPCTIL